MTRAPRRRRRTAALTEEIRNLLDERCRRARELIELPIGAERDHTCPDCGRPTVVTVKRCDGWHVSRLTGASSTARADYRCDGCAPVVRMERKR